MLTDVELSVVSYSFSCSLTKWIPRRIISHLAWGQSVICSLLVFKIFPLFKSLSEVKIWSYAPNDHFC